jgi:hypothetical protein
MQCTAAPTKFALRSNGYRHLHRRVQVQLSCMHLTASGPVLHDHKGPSDDLMAALTSFMYNAG